MPIQDQYTILVYPFFHRITGKERETRLEQLPNHWQPWWKRLNENATASGPSGGEGRQARNALERALDDTYFFLPYVRQLLFPETALLPSSDPIEQVKIVEELADLKPHALTRQLISLGMLRFTYDQKQLRALEPLKLQFESKSEGHEVGESFSASIKLDWVDVALLPQQVGFLLFKVRATEKLPTVGWLTDLLYYLRQVHKPTIDWQLANWKFSGQRDSFEFTSRDLVDFFLQGFTQVPDQTAGTVSLDDWIKTADSTSRYSSTEQGQIYGQTFRLYTYACLDVPPAAHPSASDIAGPQSSPGQEKVSPPFASLMDQTLYELATCNQVTDQYQDYTPHPSGLKQITEKGHIALWRNWEAMALHDNVVFVAARPTPFTLGALPHNVENDYFHLYLLALYQKIRLSMFSGELMRRTDNLYENLQEARELWDQFTTFRNHYWLSEVTFKPQGTELYRRFQQGLNALSLYEVVNNEVHELQQYYEHKAEQALEDTGRKLQESIAANVEATKRLQESSNRAVLAATEVANRQLELTQVMTENLQAANNLQKDMTSQLRIVANIQMKVEAIEIFVVGFYSAELTHLLIELFEKEYHLKLWWSTSLVLGVGLIAGLTTWKLLGRSPEDH